MAKRMAKTFGAHMTRKKYTLPHGQGSFYYREKDRRWVGTVEAGVSARGTRRRIVVTDKDKTRAWDKLQAKRKEIMIEGITPEGVRAGASVESWITQWVEHRQHVVRPKTWQTEASLVRRWIVPTVGRVKLEQVSPGDVRRLTDTMRRAGVSSTTARYAQRVLVQALKAALVEGHRVPQRVLAMGKPRVSVSDRSAIPFDDAVRLLQVARSRGEGGRWVAALLQGMRQGEVLGLTWDHVDLAAGTLDVSWQLQQLRYADRASGVFVMPDGYEARQVRGCWHLVRPKTRSGRRVIPLVPWMWEELSKLAATNSGRGGFVFTGADGGVRLPGEDREAWKRLQLDAGVCKSVGADGGRVLYVLHEARHTTATLLLAAGVDPEVIKAIMGHSDIVTTRGYQHVSQDMARAALRRVAATLQLE